MKNRIASPSPITALKSFPDSSPEDRVFLSESQQVAVTTLIKMVELGRNQCSYGGFRIRTAPLIYGGSGNGKTAIVSECARRLGTGGKPYPLLAISCAS